LIYVDEANTATGPFLRLLTYQDPISYYSGKGDSLGYSMASALGMKLAMPNRTIVNVAGDGAALFYPQAYWTAAKFNLPTYSGNQGWVEGALTTTEKMVQEHFGLAWPADWLPTDYYLGW
jgi:glyoxylate carboligase